VVLMHGLLAGSDTMDYAKSWIEADYPGIYVKNVEICGELTCGILPSLFLDLNLQIEQFAQIVANDTKLKNGFNLIGWSQGGIITRGYIERYNNPPVYNWISWAGPHGGQYGVPSVNYWCPDAECPWLLELFDDVMNGSWTERFIQDHISFSTYWKDPFAYSTYLNVSTVLADINNERPIKNATYKKNMLSLNTALLIYSTTDSIVIPNTSPWFQHYKVGQDTQVVSLKDTDQYRGDWLGLQTLDRQNKLQLFSIPCGHIWIGFPSCKTYYDKYTKPLLNNSL